MTDPQQLLESMAASGAPPELASHAAARRSKVVARIAELSDECLERSAAKKHRRSWLLGGLAAALVALGLGLAQHASEPAPTRQAAKPAADRPLRVELVKGALSLVHADHDAQQKGPGALLLSDTDRVRTDAGGQARLRLGSGAVATLASGSEASLRAEALSERVQLFSGAVRVQVPKLDAQAELSVETADAQVIVHGTRFEVSVHGDSTTLHTELELTEGRVEVRSRGRRLMLDAPAHWSSAPPPPTPRAKATAEVTQAPAAPAAQRRPPVVKTQPKPSTLRQENELFTAARAAQSGGQAAAALQHYDTLLARFPGSVHAPSALVERFRILNQLGRNEQAARAARLYLARYPDGFAAAEARGLALTQP